MARPSEATLKRLFALSGNQCAFTNCFAGLVNAASGILTGEICHIEADSPGGPRYNPAQTEKQRQAFDNLVLMCPAHHKIIDMDPESYTVARLKEIKAKHEDAHRRDQLGDAVATAVRLLLGGELPREQKAPRLNLGLELEPGHFLYRGIQPCFKINLVVWNEDGAATATSFSFQIKLPFLPPRMSQPVGPNRVVLPVIGRDPQSAHWIEFWDDDSGEICVRFFSPHNLRLIPGSRHVLAEIVPRTSWYGLRPGTTGLEAAGPGIRVRPLVYHCPFEFEWDPPGRSAGTAELPLYGLIPGRY